MELIPPGESSIYIDWINIYNSIREIAFLQKVAKAQAYDMFTYKVPYE